MDAVGFSYVRLHLKIGTYARAARASFRFGVVMGMLAFVGGAAAAEPAGYSFEVDGHAILPRALRTERNAGAGGAGL